MVLAERGTGFALWKDQLDNLSCYAADKEDKSLPTISLFGKVYSVIEWIG